ncbi:hypothetical protein CKJ90_13610, partial [Klebsiella pneumoniae]
PVKRPIVAVIDVPSQAYGRREEAFGIHQALAGACWKAGRWRKWLMKPLPPTPTSQSNGRSSP